MKVLHLAYLVLATEVLAGCAAYSPPTSQPYKVFDVYDPAAPGPYAVLPQQPFIEGGGYGYPYWYRYPYPHHYSFAYPRTLVPKYSSTLGPRTPNWRYGGSTRPGRRR